MNKKLKLSEVCSLYYFITRAGFLGISSTAILITAKQDGWISMFLGIIIGLIPLLMFLYISNHRQNQTILELNQNLFGKIFGKIINTILTIGIIIFTILISYDLVNFITSQYLNQTPSLAIMIMFMIAIIYMLSKGINIIARTHVILLYISVFLFLCAMTGLFKELTLLNIQPILENGFIHPLKGSLFYIAYNVLPLILLSIIPKSQIENNEKFNQSIIITYLISSITLLITLFFMIAIFGPYLATLYQYPEYHLLKLISLIGFITRVEGIIALHWLFDLLALIIMGIYFIKEYIKNTIPKIKKFNLSIIFILCILLTISVEYVFKNNTIGGFIATNIIPWILGSIFLIIPLIIFITCFLRKKET